MVELMRFDRPGETAQRSATRSRIFSARFTEDEFALLENCAGAKGQTLSDWTHDVLLQLVRDGGGGRMEMLLFTEVIGLEMLLMNALAPLVSGENLTREQYASLIETVRSSKAKAAQDVLARRLASREI